MSSRLLVQPCYRVPELQWGPFSSMPTTSRGWFDVGFIGIEHLDFIKGNTVPHELPPIHVKRVF